MICSYLKCAYELMVNGGSNPENHRTILCIELMILVDRKSAVLFNIVSHFSGFAKKWIKTIYELDVRLNVAHF